MKYFMKKTIKYHSFFFLLNEVIDSLHLILAKRLRNNEKTHMVLLGGVDFYFSLSLFFQTSSTGLTHVLFL